MATKRQQRRARRGLTLWSALALVLCLLSHADARQEGDCAAPAGLAARAEELSAQWKAPALREALGLFERAGACWGRSGLRREEAGALGRAADMHFLFGEYPQAVKAYGEALAVYRETGDRPAEARALVHLGRAKLFTLNLDDALRHAQEAAALARSLGERGLEAGAENVVGKYNYRRGEYQKAAGHYTQALQLARAAGEPAEEAQALYGLGQVHGDVGELPEALAHYQRALPLWQAANRRQDEVRTLNSLALVYALTGESQKALEQLEGASLPFERESGDRMGEATAHNTTGYVYQTLGDYEAALSHYRAALAIYEQINMTPGQALSALYVGDLCATLGRTQEAEEQYERSLAASRALGNSMLEAEVLNSLGSLRLSTGKGEEAYELFRQALSAYEKGEYLRGQAAALNNIGWYFGGRGDWRAGAGHFRRALKFFRSAGDRLNESLTLYNLARAELETGDAAGARLSVEEGLRITESLRTKIAGGELRASYFATAHRQFELYIAALMRLHARDRDPALAAAAFEASERSRARSLLETLAESHADIRRGVEPQLLERERELQLRLDAKAERRIQLLAGKADAKELAEVERQIGELTSDFRRVQGQIRASSPRYAELIQPTPLTLDETQRRVLDADTVLLEYALGDERSFVWVVTADSFKSFELPGRARVEEASRRVYELLTARNRQAKGETARQWQERVTSAEAEYDEAAAALGAMVLGPIAAELGRKRLVVVADGALQYVPFGALPVPGGGGGGEARAAYVPLIAEHEVVSLPSASVLALARKELHGRLPAPKAVAVLADPVFDDKDERLAQAKSGVDVGRPGVAVAARRALRSFEEFEEGAGIARLVFSRREANAIMASVPAGEGMLALGFRASRATATGPELSRYRIIHLATHGRLDSEHPELSGVILSLFDESGQRQDGFLELNEIYNLNLPAELVVLSACQTALGKDVKGEGLVGLTRGFMYAGARRVVASLWKVDDSATAELMGQFYREMLGKGLKGRRPADALREAQLYMWRQPRWRSPYFWAAFTLQGEWK